MQEYDHRSIKIRYRLTGQKQKPVIVWAHGWGQNHMSFLPVVQSLSHIGTHILLDLPGFGSSDMPKDSWGTADYANAMAALIKNLTPEKVVWAGHSFGCRVGLQLAARHPELVQGLFLIAAAGLKRKRPLYKILYMRVRIRLFKSMKKLIPFGMSEKWLMKKFASPDYLNAGPLREIFVKTVNEDLEPLFKDIKCPVVLVYGINDNETPPEFGQRMQKGITNSQLILLPAQDHYSVLADGRHQVTPIFKQFIESLA